MFHGNKKNDRQKKCWNGKLGAYLCCDNKNDYYAMFEWNKQKEHMHSTLIKVHNKIECKQKRHVSYIYSLLLLSFMIVCLSERAIADKNSMSIEHWIYVDMNVFVHVYAMQSQPNWHRQEKSNVFVFFFFWFWSAVVIRTNNQLGPTAIQFYVFIFVCVCVCFFPVAAF